MFIFAAHTAFAGPCEDAERYYQLWQQADAEGAEAVQQAAGNGGILGGLAALGTGLDYAQRAAYYKSKYEQAAAECARLRSQQGGTRSQPALRSKATPRPKVTGPKTQNFGERGYGPERTGLDWKPFLADLVPRAVASQLRQGKGYADKGDWASAANHYDQAAGIDPNNRLARRKADEARQKLKEEQPPPSTPPPSTPPPTSPPPSTPAPQSVPPATPPPSTPPPAPAPSPDDLTNFQLLALKSKNDCLDSFLKAQRNYAVDPSPKNMEALMVAGQMKDRARLLWMMSMSIPH